MMNEKEKLNRIKQFKRIVISFADYKEAFELSKYVLSTDLYEKFDDNFLLLSSLTNSMIISYAKPFSGNDSKTQNKIPDLQSNALKILNEEEKELHNWLMNLRNTLVAHSDSEAVNLKFTLHDYGFRKMLQPIRNRSSKPFTIERLKQFHHLSEKLLSYVAEVRLKTEKDIIEILDVGDIEEILNIPQHESS